MGSLGEVSNQNELLPEFLLSALLLRGLGARHCLIQVPGSREMRSWGSNLLELESQLNNFQGKTSMAPKYTEIPMVWPPKEEAYF